MSKHSEWLEKRNQAVDNGEFRSFSVGMFIFNLFTIINFLIVILIIIDFVLEPNTSNAKLSYFGHGRASLYYSQGGYDNINVGDNFNDILKEKSNVQVNFTPLFNYRTTIIGYDNREEIFEMSAYEVIIPIFTCIVITSALFYLILFPALNEKYIRNNPVKFSDFIGYRYDYLNHVQLVFVLPIILGLMHWYKLLVFFDAI